MEEKIINIQSLITDKYLKKLIEEEMEKHNPDFLWLRVEFDERAEELFKEYKDHYDYLYAARFFEILNLASEGFEKVEIIAKKDACEKCKSQDFTVLTVKEALDKMLLPHKECTTYCDIPGEPHDMGWCRCFWAPVIWDEFPEDDD